MAEFLKGKKSHLMGLAAVFYGVFGIVSGHLSPDDGVKIIWAGLTTAALRAGIAKAGE